MEIILASESPRRAELLKQIGVPFRVVPSRITEGLPRQPWAEWVQELARQKASAVAAGYGDIVLAADTIVVLGEQVLGKPRDKEEAAAMLRSLSDSSHQVLTGICLLCHRQPRPTVFQGVEITRVTFRQLSEPEIISYVASGEPLDKAGAYGIQGLGALLVKEICGCYYNVVGLPLVKTMELLRDCGYPLLGVAKA